MNRFGNIDSKFRFVILASKRAKQLLKGAKPKMKTKSKNPIRIAQAEVRSGVVDYEILPAKKDDFQEQEERVFIGEGLPDEIIETDEAAAGKEALTAEAEAGADLEDEGIESEEDNEEKEEEKDES